MDSNLLAAAINRIIESLDKIENKQSEHTVTLAEYNLHLKDHMERTRNLEERVEPIEDHVKFISKSSKVFMYVVTILSALGGVAILFLKK